MRKVEYKAENTYVKFLEKKLKDAEKRLKEGSRIFTIVCDLLIETYRELESKSMIKD